MFNEIFVDIGVLTKFKIILPERLWFFFFSVNKINLSKSEQQHNLTMVLNIYFLIQFVRGKKTLLFQKHHLRRSCNQSLGLRSSFVWKNVLKSFDKQRYAKCSFLLEIFQVFLFRFPIFSAVSNMQILGL